LRRSAEEAVRAEAARQRSEAARQRADAAQTLADSARRRAGYVADQLGGSSAGAERKRKADRREAEAAERESVSREQEHWGEHGGPGRALRLATLHSKSLSRSSTALVSQAADLRAQAAELADQIADQAESFAAYLESRHWRSDSELKLAIAGTEREIARMEHQMATRLRSLDVKYERGDPLPQLPRPTVDRDTPPSREPRDRAD
jgi:hypothetical protein